MKADTTTAGAFTVAGGTTKDVGSIAARAATHAVGNAAVKRGIGRRNASATSGVVKQSVPTATTEGPGHIGSARSSSTVGAEG